MQTSMSSSKKMKTIILMQPCLYNKLLVHAEWMVHIHKLCPGLIFIIYGPFDLYAWMKNRNWRGHIYYGILA